MLGTAAARPRAMKGATCGESSCQWTRAAAAATQSVHTIKTRYIVRPLFTDPGHIGERDATGE